MALAGWPVTNTLRNRARACSGRLTVGVCVSLATVGCTGRHVNRQDLTGVYRLQYPYGVEELRVRADGTYRQSYADSGKSLTEINRGKWDLQAGDFGDGQLLVLHDPVIVDELGKRTNLTPSNGLWAIRIRKPWFGRMKLLVYEDLGYEFVKVE